MSNHVHGARVRARRVLFAAAALLVASAASPPGVAARDDAPGRPYLALGDSVAFGYITQAGVYVYGNPTNFVGFPERVGEDQGFTVVNASCPGQTSTSLITNAAPDNGCIFYRGHFPLHVTYSGSQLDFAQQWLRGHHDTKLVTLQVGANDAFLLQKQCATAVSPGTCFQDGVPTLLQTIATNLDTIFNGLRGTGYQGRIVAVTYYSLDYSDATGTALTGLLDSVITASAKAHGAIVADAFASFQAATRNVGGSACRAGLLNVDPTLGQFACDVHPSQSGQQLLARTVEHAVAVAGG